jgi:two-component system KDP operon response regulator KdpE
VLVAQLRKKIELDPSHPRYLLSEPWVGYRLATGQED